MRTKSKLAAPMVKRYRRGDRLPVQAQQIWMILTSFVMARRIFDRSLEKTIEYGHLAELMGYSDARAGHMLGRQLGIVGHYCRENGLPLLNVIVIAKATGAPGAEVLLRPDRSLKDEQKAVLKEDWFTVRPPTTGTLRTVMERFL